MADQKTPPPATAAGPDEEFDRQSYLKEIRQNLLRNLGLPEDTKPEQVVRLLEIKQKMKKMN